MRIFSCRTVCLVFLVCCLSSTVFAQGLPDRVIIRTESGNGRKTYYGTVEAYGAAMLSLRLLRRDSVKEIPASQIIKVETPLTQHHITALEFFEKHDITNARKEFERALTDEKRKWVRADLRGMLIRCDARQGDFVAAGQKFIPLVGDDSRSRHFDFVPLPWQAPKNFSPEEPQRWLRLRGKTPRLLGAAILLEDEQNGAEARKVLQELARSGDPIIQQLAAIQQWRLRLAKKEPVRDGELQGWQSQMRSLPQRHRAAAHFLIGRAQMKRLEYDDAALSLLRTPLIYTELQPRLAFQSAQQAMIALTEAGRGVQSAAMAAEIARRFPDLESK